MQNLSPWDEGMEGEGRLGGESSRETPRKTHCLCLSVCLSLSVIIPSAYKDASQGALIQSITHL